MEADFPFRLADRWVVGVGETADEMVIYLITRFYQWCRHFSFRDNPVLPPEQSQLRKKERKLKQAGNKLANECSRTISPVFF